MPRSVSHPSVAHALLLTLAAGCGGAAATTTRLTTGEPTAPVPSAGLAACSEDGVAELAARFSAAVERAEGRRDAPGPTEITDAAIADLLACFESDPSLRSATLDLFYEMRSPRALPALLVALDWEDEESEALAVSAARTLAELTLGETERLDAITALDAALLRIEGSEGIDNRLRIQILRALGATGDARAVPALARTARLLSESQSFLINRLAVEQLGELADPSAIPVLIECLLLFDPQNPLMRTNDVAAAGLARIGPAAVPPLLSALALENEQVNDRARAYIEAVRARDARFAAQMDPSAIVVGEASVALGAIGSPLALDALVREVEALDRGERASSVETDLADLQREFSCALALVSIVPRDATDTERIRNALLRMYSRTPPDFDPARPTRMQLIVAMQHLADPELLSFFLDVARPPRSGEGDANARVLAIRAATRSGVGAALAPLEEIFAAEPEGDVRYAIEDMGLRAAVAMSRACDRDTACFIGHLHDAELGIASTAASALAILGRGDPTVLAGLVAALDVRDENTIVDILYAIDRVAVAGSDAAVAVLEQLEDELLGTAFWAHVASLASTIRGRLAARAAP